MAVKPELLIAAIYGAILLLAAVGQYLNRPRQAAKIDPAVVGVGLELGNRQQVDQLISALNRIADILEDKRQAGFEHKLQELGERLEQALAERQHAPRRRRRPASG